MTQSSLEKAWQEHFNKGVNNAMEFLNTRPELKQFVKDFDGKDGFMFTQDERINTIGNALASDGHSGCSFACTLRECQRLLFEMGTEEDEIDNIIGPPCVAFKPIKNEPEMRRCVTPEMN